MLRLYVKNFAKHKEVRNPGCVTLGFVALNRTDNLFILTD
jgi:hypothetical protein